MNKRYYVDFTDNGLEVVECDYEAFIEKYSKQEEKTLVAEGCHKCSIYPEDQVFPAGRKHVIFSYSSSEEAQKAVWEDKVDFAMRRGGTPKLHGTKADAEKELEEKKQWDAQIYKRTYQVSEFSGTKSEYSLTPKAGFEPVYYTNYTIYTDVQSYEIVKVTGKKQLTIHVRRLKATQTETIPCTPGGFVGHSENGAQKWTYESDPEAPVKKATLRKDGTFRFPGTAAYTRGLYVSLSESPCEHYDYNF